MKFSWSTRQKQKQKLWKGIKQLLCLKSKGSTLPGKLIINEQEITNDKAIADKLLNKFFSESSIRNNLALHCSCTKTKSAI